MRLPSVTDMTNVSRPTIAGVEKPEVPTAPAGLGEVGRDLWADVLASFVLERHERAALADACRVRDVVAELDEVIAREGTTIERETGPAPHPVLAALARERTLYGRIIASLALPDEETGKRPTRHGGPRGPRGYYSIGGRRRLGSVS
jgi:hypothetical protein